MRYWKASLLFLLAGDALGASAVEYTDRLIVKLRAPASGAQVHTIMSASQESSLSRIAGIRLARVRPMSGGGQVMGLPQWMTVEEAQTVAATLQGDPGIEYAEPDRIRYPRLVPNDGYYSSQWNLNGTYGMRLPVAWDSTTGSNAVVVAVIDTGITSHSELSGRTVPGYDFISDTFIANDGDGRDADPSDPGDWVTAPEIAANSICAGNVASDSSWHGTGIGGIIGAVSNNAAGIAGINWVSGILPVRVLGKCGGYVSDIADGMRWAAGLSVSGVPDNPNPAKVLNLSLGGSGACSTTEQNAVSEIVAANKVVVVAAGNESGDVANSSPANCSGVIVVAATTATGSLSSLSNTGSLVTVSAPGDSILSVWNSGTTVPATEIYAYFNGTSGAAAAVSGVVSLLFSINSQLSPAQVRSILQSTVTAFPDATCTTSTCGAGIVNAAAAVSLASSMAGTPTSASSSGGGGGGGGCAAGLRAPFDPLLLCLAGAALARLCWRRTRRQ